MRKPLGEMGTYGSYDTCGRYFSTTFLPLMM